ncbi:MAG TPA: hypothetical protein VGM04_06890 [Sphingomicrobium sp.]|jgi:hypothetical protein
MKYSACALAVVAVAGMASAQTKWVPLDKVKQDQRQAASSAEARSAGYAQAQQALSGAGVPVSAASPLPVAAPPPAGNAILRVGTEVPLRLNEELTTKGKKLRVGDRFHLETAEPVMIQGVNVIPVGTPAVGEITEFRNKGMWGKSGRLEARILYMTVYGRQIRLSGSFDDKGVAGGWGAAAVSAFVFLPAGFFMTGTSARIPAGTVIKSFIEEDVPLAMPVAAQGPLPVAAAAPLQVQPAATGQQH